MCKVICTVIAEGINFLCSIILLLLCSYIFIIYVWQNECAKKLLIKLKSKINKKKKPTDEKPIDEKPTDEKPTDEKPTDEKPTDEKPTDEKPTDEKPTDEKPTDDNRKLGLLDKIRIIGFKFLDFLYQTVIKIDDSPCSKDAKFANVLATGFFIFEVFGSLFGFIEWIIYGEYSNIDNLLRKFLLIIAIIVYFIVVLFIVIAIQKLLKFTFLGVRNFVNVIKHIGKKWEYICFIVILSYASELAITRITWWESFSKWFRIGLILLVLRYLMVMIYDLVIKAIEDDLKYDYRVFIKFIICAIILQVSCLSLIMLDGVMLSKQKEKQESTVEQISEGSTIEQVPEGPADDQVSNESMDKQISEEQDNFAFHYPEDINSLFDSSSTSENINQDNNSPTSPHKNRVKLIGMSLYFVTITYTSVGYGEIYPTSTFARFFSIGVSVLGYLMSAIFIGILLGGIKSSSDDKKVLKDLIEWKKRQDINDSTLKDSIILRKSQKDICESNLDEEKTNCTNNDSLDKNE